MVSLAAAIDRDRDRRARFLANVRDHIAPLPDLEVRQAELGDLAVCWAQAPGAPQSLAKGAGYLSILFGDAHEGGKRVGAEALLPGWLDAEPSKPVCFDGIHVGLCYDPERGLAAGVDFLGMLPLWYWSNGETLLLGTSSHPFARHPSFEAAVDPEGLAAIVLNTHVFGGRGLLRGVRRVGMGRVLRVDRSLASRELTSYALPEAAPFRPHRFERDVETLHEVVDDAVRRHVPEDVRFDSLLSGGRDSRVLAGALHARGRRGAIYTMGEPGDDDLSGARAMAHTLGWPFRPLSGRESTSAALAAHHVRWHQLSVGLNTPIHWALPAQMKSRAERLVHGYLSDYLIGGSRFATGRGADGRTRFDDYLDNVVAAWSFPAPVVRRLLRRDAFGDALDTALTRMRADYDRLPGAPEHRLLSFEFRDRFRCHVGSAIWPLTFGPWPVAPINDRRVVEAAFSLPIASLADRRAQDALLRRYHPHLARLPLARAQSDMTPIAPDWRWRWGGPLRRLQARFAAPRGAFYDRTWSFDNDDWRAVRRAAEPHRERLEPWLHMDVVNELLPCPEDDLPDGPAHPVARASGPKLLLGLMLWLAEQAE